MASKKRVFCEPTDTFSKELPEKKKTIYKQKFIKEYTKDYPFVQESSKGEFYAFCSICSLSFAIGSSGRFDVKQHATSKSHELAATNLDEETKAGRLKTKQSCLSFKAFKPESNQDEIHQVTRAEAEICLYLARNNVPVNNADRLVELVRAVAPDSKVAKGGCRKGQNNQTTHVYKCGRCFSSELLC